MNLSKTILNFKHTEPFDKKKKKTIGPGFNSVHSMCNSSLYKLKMLLLLLMFVKQTKPVLL